MKTIMKWFVGFIVVLGIGIGIFFGVGAIMDQQVAKDEQAEAEPKTDPAEGEEEERVRELSEEKFENSEDDASLNPFGDPYSSDDMSDSRVQEYIHKMSHQKVQASEKWGFYRITDERIAWLQESLDASEESLKHYNLYKSILDRWAAGDFSRADEDHNAIWKLQGGTIGRATGILSAEEERAYINSAKEN
ncbi:DUF6241 domain-containing protein [Piscibacillus sp. B03]|uniref:DUF6241 domain-containing protein n=1 Tax=Piscibacillus sp. B03 TaxID=3457430 RepID=UPI003FCC62D0